MDLKADKKSLRQLLALEEQQFRIPPYQRPYSWTSEQVDDLWEDLVENAESGHFLGSVVLSTENEFRPLVIDGQQRLTTLMILMSAIRDACDQRGLSELVARITQRLTSDNLAEGDDYFKFKTGGVNWPVFRDFVLRAPDDPKRRDIASIGSLDHDALARNASLIDNLKRMRGHLAERLDGMSAEAQASWLKAFDKALVSQVELVVIEVRELADAFLLFETLNDRGLQLSAADLLKSHLLGQIAKSSTEEEVAEAAVQWDDMLEDLGANVDVSRFLRHYLLGSLQTVKKDEVFGHFKALVSQNDAAWVLQDIRKAAKIYGEFEDPSGLKHEATRRVLSDLQTLRATSCYIALLPARRFLSVDDFVDFAKLAEVLTFRYSSVVGLGSNDLERKYRDAAQALTAGNGTDGLEKARTILIGAMPDSESFKLAFAKMRMGTQYLVRYTLRRIEEHIAPSTEKKLQANSLVHIEHIMPQTLSDGWRKSLGSDVEFHDEYVNRYGNLTLLLSTLNIPASNSPFAAKQKFYVHSEVEMTRRLLEPDAWGLSDIEARQDWLAEVADQIWTVSKVSSDSTDRKRRGRAIDHFRDRLGDLWDSVAPYCVEVSPEDVLNLGTELPRHLASTDHSARASELSERLLALLNRWEELDAGEREVAAAAVRYFLEVDDHVPDGSTGGLEDDALVVDAAELALR